MKILYFLFLLLTAILQMTSVAHGRRGTGLNFSPGGRGAEKVGRVGDFGGRGRRK